MGRSPVVDRHGNPPRDVSGRGGVRDRESDRTADLAFSFVYSELIEPDNMTVIVMTVIVINCGSIVIVRIQMTMRDPGVGCVSLMDMFQRRDRRT